MQEARLKMRFKVKSNRSLSIYDVTLLNSSSSILLPRNCGNTYCSFSDANEIRTILQTTILNNSLKLAVTYLKTLPRVSKSIKLVTYTLDGEFESQNTAESEGPR